MIDRVSVIMPTYNAMPFVKDAVSSILAQTFKAFEFLIINDISDDGTDAYLDSLTDPRIRVIHQKKQGLVVALNKGIQEARYDWIARMDADDEALPRRLQREVEFVEQNPQYALISCGWGYIGRNCRRMKATQSHKMASPPYYQPLIDPMILDQGMLFNKNAVIKVGGYRGIGNAEGMDLCLRLDEAGYLMTSLSDFLMLVRALPNGITATKFTETRLMWQYYRECSKARRIGKKEPEQESFIKEHWPHGFRLLRAIAAREFRLAGSEWGAGHYFSAGSRLFLSMVLRPRYVLSKLHTYFLSKEKQ